MKKLPSLVDKDFGETVLNDVNWKIPIVMVLMDLEISDLTPYSLVWTDSFFFHSRYRYKSEHMADICKLVHICGNIKDYALS
ncbi:hypothetical protein KIN20_024156 [Parelaphostrongylus tenuis]|uniref:Uncharacterized protein n=1 Tax=Parelaphostrongylus tenuis TaxID=148309 RepID=A0AAD5QXK2_PARTN|nr:hypothetical protein KIN20_024156 [Parelaphostrongylus tenuis]